MRYQSQPTMQQPIASTEGQLFESLAARLSRFAEQQANELDREMAKKAKHQGLMDAQGKTDIVLRDGTTIADEAWNEGAIVSHVAAVKLDMTENLARIEAANARDPEGYEASAKGYSSGLLEGVPEILRPAIQDELASTMLKTQLGLTADKASFDREQHTATTNTAIDLYRADGENKAKTGDIVGSTEAQIKAIELTDALERAGLLSPKAAEIQRNNITRDIEDQVIYGQFTRELENGTGLSFLDKFNKLKELGDRDPDYRKKMSNTMLGMIKASHAAADGLRKQEENERKDRWRAGERKIATLDLDGALIVEHLQEMVENDELDPKVADKYKKNAFLEGPEFSSQIAINEIKADLLGATEFDIQTDPRLSRIDKDKMVNERRALEEDKSNWKATQNGREGARRINSAFGIIKGVDTRISKEKAQRAGVVLTRYFNEIENLPIEERELRAVEVSDRLVKEVNNEISATDLEKAKDRLMKAPYQTEEQIKEADLGSEEERVQILQLNRKLKRIERLERQIGQ